ncbi:hypothetical protein [Tissierella sp. Yu-01]|uniref:hypothetical protein n=1 Tax=Tissierella sp. Yu-01 TaxID=3035694 RepID=UPI00240D7556|nr:hypothetical protein [Tissierella sp. Yu-01]WFA09264.1 hypothetical protein P3962_01445 [Tissierella sp. Yu-01]
MDNEYLYIVLTRTNTVMSRLIQLLKKDEYTHAAISFDKNLDQMYSFGRRHTFNPFVGRFKKEEIDKGIYKLCKTVPSVVIELKVSKQQYEKAKYVLERFISNSNLYKYNYMGLLYNLLNKPVCCDYSFLCSEFVYYILNESGIVDFKKSRNLIRPENLLDIEGRMIYKGDLKNMRLSYETYGAEEIEIEELKRCMVSQIS